MKNLMILAAAVATVAIAPAFAEDMPAQGGKMQHLNLTPEQKEAMHKRMEQRRAQWEKMSPAQKEEAKKRMEAARDHWKNMTPEQKAEAKAHMEKRREKWEHMSAEQKAGAKAKWEKMTPAERQAMAAKHHKRIQELQEKHKLAPVAEPGR